MTNEEIDIAFELASRSTEGECNWGNLSPELDPAEWFATCIGKRSDESRPVYTVSVPSDKFPGETYLLVAVTGNGPQSEANAQFFAIARNAVMGLVNDLLSTRRILRPFLQDRYRVQAAQLIVDACLNGYAKGKMNDGKYLPPDVREAIRQYEAILSGSAANFLEASRPEEEATE